MTELQVALVSPEREVWSGAADMVLARTLEGEIGILAGHQPLLGVLVEGGIVRIRRGDRGQDLDAAVGGGFLSVSENQVSILAEQAELGDDVDVAEARDALEGTEASDKVTTEASYQCARLRAAGHES